jgi:formate dehydrogenase major subunit
VFQIMRRHFSRYTPEMVEQICGTPKALFLRVAEMLAENSGPERTARPSSTRWAGRSIRMVCRTLDAAALLQLSPGEHRAGRAAASWRLRGHATIQGSTDVPTLYHSIQGYMAHPDVTATRTIRCATIS